MAIISFFIFFSSPVIFALQALPFVLSFCNPYAKSRADSYSRNNNLKFWMNFFIASLTFKYSLQKLQRRLSRAFGPYLHKFNNFIALEISRVSTISQLSTILSRESASQRILLDFCIF